MSIDDIVGVESQALSEADSSDYSGREDAQHSVYDRILDESVASEGMYLPHDGRTIDFDAYVSHVVDIHFDEEIGAPYWQEVHKELRNEYGDEFDIREKVAEEGYDAIGEYLPKANEGALKELSVEEFMPDIYGPGGTDLSKSSGTTGAKKIMPWAKEVSDVAIDWYGWNLTQRGTGDGNWLECGPYGLYEKHLEGAANKQGGLAFFSGIETRKLKKQLKHLEGPMSFLKGPLSAIKAITRMGPTEQALQEDLEKEYVENIASAPQVVERLHPVLEEDRTASSPEDIETILISGTGVTDDTVDTLDDLYENADIVPMYAASFTGPAFNDPELDGIRYHPMAPIVQLDVVDSETGEEVAYGERGQVEINRIGPDFFWPNQRERETAVRKEPTEHFDWSGIADVQPLDN